MVNQSLPEGREEAQRTGTNECWPDSNVRNVHEDEQAEKNDNKRTQTERWRISMLGDMGRQTERKLNIMAILA